MNYSIKTIPQFDKQLKRLVKKYASFTADFIGIVESLRESPMQGVPIGKNCYKIRMAITSKGRGKSGGARVITTFVVKDATVYLISIYDKSEKGNLTNNELDSLLAKLS